MLWKPCRYAGAVGDRVDAAERAHGVRCLPVAPQHQLGASGPLVPQHLVDADLAINCMMWQNAGCRASTSGTHDAAGRARRRTPAGEFTPLGTQSQVSRTSMRTRCGIRAAGAACCGRRVWAHVPEPYHYAGPGGAARGRTRARSVWPALAPDRCDGGNYDMIVIPQGLPSRRQALRVFTKPEYRILRRVGCGKSTGPGEVVVREGRSGAPATHKDTDNFLSRRRHEPG
jgi:hypothetical protein